MNKQLLVGLAVFLGIVFLVLSFVYFTKPAQMLPSYLPGYQAGLVKTHYKHGIAALIVALGAFSFAWFQSGKKSVKK